MQQDMGAGARLPGEREDVAHAASRRTGRRVLILDFDLYKSVGGGQSSYRKLIELNPEDTYHYLIRDEPASAPRPANARPIPFSQSYYANIGDLPAEMAHFYYDYLECWQIAASVRAALGAASIDVVDTPDYKTLGLFIRPALEAHGLFVGVVALALHGTISSALRDEWSLASPRSRTLAELRLREHMQYRTADVRYALAATYAESWRKYTGFVARPLDPLLMVGPLEPVLAPAGGAPDVLFVGRRERRKGPDIFADFLWALDRGSYGRALIIGGESGGATGMTSASVLDGMLERRKLAVAELAALPRDALDTRFKGRNVVVLPSRYDQFNLIALEAWRMGCPAFVSRQAGVADWLLAEHPSLAEFVIDIDCSRAGAGALRSALSDYDGTRRRLTDTLGAARSRAGDLETAKRIYVPDGAVDAAGRAVLRDIQLRLGNFNQPRHLSERGLKPGLKRKAKLLLPKPVKAAIVSTIQGVGQLRQSLGRTAQRRLARQFARNAVRRLPGLRQDGAPALVRRAADLEGVRGRLLHAPERTSAEIKAKLAAASNEIGTTRLARAKLFREMARLERKRGGDLIAATYCLRIMRWLGGDTLGDLDFVTSTLQAHGFVNEAEAAEAMYRDAAGSTARCRALLEAQYQRHRSKPDLPFEILDDRRSGGTARVAVIASLYNAETKLRTLVRNIAIQSLAARGQVEVVLVDSGSPTAEYRVFKDLMHELSLPVVYARSRNRETIQAAWNRGIKLARAPYLCFLGADEGLHPDALSRLAAELDAHADVDWVMADSIVTNVDAQGVFAGDVMTYDRRGYDQNLVQLETCYLSWVGGLYRRSIHDRFGYYDESFRAAGDTEFKSRILRHIRTRHVPQLLGVFNNYPEERTTQHPRAEIEDLRAWYLHRTQAGIAYAYDDLPVERAEDMFRRSLAYRKSYCGHLSTDFDMADAVGRYLKHRGQSGAFGGAAAAAGRDLVTLARRIDDMSFMPSPRQRQLQMLRTLHRFERCRAAHRTAFELPELPDYRLLNDNRYEQHWWSWSA